MEAREQNNGANKFKRSFFLNHPYICVVFQISSAPQFSLLCSSPKANPLLHRRGEGCSKKCAQLCAFKPLLSIPQTLTVSSDNPFLPLSFLLPEN